MTDCEYKEICQMPRQFCPEDPLDCKSYEYYCEDLDKLEEKMPDA